MHTLAELLVERSPHYHYLRQSDVEVNVCTVYAPKCGGSTVFTSKNYIFV